MRLIRSFLDEKGKVPQRQKIGQGRCPIRKGKIAGFQNGSDVTA
jgi:hypothetical protein